MKKNAKNVLVVLGLVALFTVGLTLDAKSQSSPPCEPEVVVITGTIMNENPNNPMNYECMGAFTDCTDAWVVDCKQQ
ncbi:hypothetical protein [Roseivirga spongicola]|uniref:hypothetical protein n=1 Tax=Roseivirga spongicola TaxID=333140 RepID=UPI002AC96608|nr:hypothetical protein [Roseivirga spongicola]WPZ11519.1 hypothetical protein T7867_05300 [Roseivirga spongicola]